MELMNSRQRMLTAMRNQQPDRVPAAPDISTYIPMRHSGRTAEDFWTDAKDMPLWRAYLNAAVDYGIDGWVAASMWLPVIYEDSPVERQERETFDAARDAMIYTAIIKTPAGSLQETRVCYRGDQPAPQEKLLKDFPADFRKFTYLRSMPAALDQAQLAEFKRECQARDFAFGVSIGYPGFHNWNSFVQGGVEALSYVEMDTPEILEEWFELDMAIGTRTMELALEAGLDYILFGGSGTMTMASPALVEKYVLPALQKWSAMAKAADIPTMIHSCGKNRLLADLLAEQTDICMLNPLERPPMGDIDLAEIKTAHGHRLSFMGNLHTTDVMLNGSVSDVRRESLQAIRAAGEYGGFILSTGDQCGRDTPDENIREIVNVAKEFGGYPLDLAAIDREIHALERVSC